MTLAEQITQLRAYALTAKTAIYNEDAMTAIELAGQTACKVNECVEVINNMLDLLDALIKEFDIAGVQYDPATENIII